MTEMQFLADPLIIVYRNADRHVVTHLHHGEGDTYQGFGLLIYDLVRHVAQAFHVTDDEVWEWVLKERHHPTTDIRRPS